VNECSVDNCVPLFIQQNTNNGSNVFNRSWAEYKVGFNDSKGNYWLGNELIHQLTMINGYHKLRIELRTRAGGWVSYEYTMIRVLPEMYNYLLIVAGFSAPSSWDAFGYSGGSNTMMFSTYDRDNDRWSSGNCAAHYGGGFWYNNCGHAFLNSNYNNLKWKTNYLLSSRMWLQCI